MVTRVILAAGGGGDAVASAMIDAALYGTEDPAVILTYAWDRLLIAGPGLDGELPTFELEPFLGRLVHTLTPKDVEPIGAVLDWHPSEPKRAAYLSVEGD